MNHKKNDYEHSEGNVSEETRYYAHQLQKAVREFATDENLPITAIETKAIEGEKNGKTVTTFEVTLISSELSIQEIDEQIKRSIN